VTSANATIRQAIYDAVDLPGVNRYKYPPESLNVPAVVIAGLDIVPQSSDYNRTVTVQLIVIVSHSHVDQLESLDRLLDETANGSVLQAISDDNNELGVSLDWTSAGSYGDIAWNGVSYYGAVVTVEAFT
jgi:hypothetical protein